MSLFKLKKDIFDSYDELNGINTIKKQLLYDFLRADASLTHGIEIYREWCEESSDRPICANATCIYLEEGNVHIEFSYDDECNEQCIIPQKAFLYILDEWEKV